MTSRRAGVALLLGATLLAYLPALQGGFVWDDDSYLTENPTVRSPDGLGRIWLDTAANPQYYPLTFTSFWIEHRLWGLAPFGYHLVNVLLHALASILLWRVLCALELESAFFAAMLFALHPVAVESVAWVTERKNTLSAVFYLAAALAYLRPTLGREPSVRAWPAIPLFACALLSKSVTATLPVALLLVIVWKRGREALSRLPSLGMMAAMGLAAGLHTAFLERRQVGAATGDALDWIERVLLAGRAFWFYLGKLLAPVNLAFFYPRWEIDAGDPLQYLLPIGVVALLGTLVLLRRTLGVGPLVALLFFGITLFPALGFLDVFPMRFSWVADHFQYLAMIGPIALGAEACSRLFRPPALRLSGAALLLAVLGLATWSHAGSFRDRDELWTRTVERNPGAWLAWLDLGNLRAEQGRLEEAEQDYLRALAAKPDYVQALNNLGRIRSGQGRWAEAAALFERAVDADPARGRSRYNLGIALSRSGNPQRGIQELRRALRSTSAAPGEPEWVRRYREEILDPPPGLRHSALAMLLGATGRWSQAEEHFRKALEERPDLQEAWVGLGDALRKQGRPDEAREAYREAMRLDAVDGPGR